MRLLTKRRWGFKVWIVVLSLIVVGLGGWWLSGGRWYFMTTPSMSPSLPVGTLVLTRPATQIKVGKIYAFNPPGQAVIFMHQVVAKNRQGGYLTKGFLNSSRDPWVITKTNVLGQAVLWLPVAGWFMKALPFWIILTLLWGGLAYWRYRQAWMGWWLFALAIAGPIFYWHILVNAEVIAAIARKGAVHMYLVSTGILPAQVSVLGKVLGVLGAGQAQVFSTQVSNGNGPVFLNLTAHLPWWGWGIMALICLVPLLSSIGTILRAEAGQVSHEDLPIPLG